MSDETKIFLFIISFGLVALILSGGNEPDPCQNYRKMRQIWEDSNHEYGWPEYEAGKDEECGYES